MGWSYNPAGFSDVNQGTYVGSTRGIRWQLRLLIHDINVNKQLMQDEEIDWIQTQEMNVWTMAARCCEVLISICGIVKSKKISEFGIVYDSEFYRKTAAEFRARGSSYQVPYAGGINPADRDTDAADIQPAFKRNQGNNPGAPQQDPPSTSPLTTI